MSVFETPPRPLKDKLMTCTNICPCSHNSDIIASEITGIPTLILQWHYMSIIASQITGISIVCSKFILFQKRNTEVWSPILLSFCEEKPPVFSLTKEQSFRNHFHAIASCKSPIHNWHQLHVINGFEWQKIPPTEPQNWVRKSAQSFPQWSNSPSQLLILHLTIPQAPGSTSSEH